MDVNLPQVSNLREVREVRCLMEAGRHAGRPLRINNVVELGNGKSPGHSHNLEESLIKGLIPQWFIGNRAVYKIQYSGVEISVSEVQRRGVWLCVLSR